LKIEDTHLAMVIEFTSTELVQLLQKHCQLGPNKQNQKESSTKNNSLNNKTDVCIGANHKQQRSTRASNQAAVDIGNREKRETKLCFGDLGKVASQNHNSIEKNSSCSEFAVKRRHLKKHGMLNNISIEITECNKSEVK
jgi:hypothetical protein